ncbi:head GIN domain-containing protein [Flammeovirga aprica]|uniref:DUF2807 domain-containing protein n=1 Tax=Flammeovirga aprica JL-4 TaxID=694437 RepID=A0A7X9RU21_9BACT|nr:head GIN domain-containing protein [Flammeovirga aprica]NME68554.1 DUF2807 domain-containing protein [Flammeovirga aprica JL-4]
MKTKLITISFLLLISNFLQAQDHNVRSLGSFEKIEIKGILEVNLTAGKKNKAEISMLNGNQGAIITEVIDGTLYVKPKGNNDHIRAEIDITYKKKIKSIKYSGFTNIKSSGKIRSKELVIIGGGAGLFTGDVNVKKLTINHNGAGEVEMSGRAKSVNVSLSGAADIDMTKMQTNHADVSVSGAGDVKCWATEEINARVSGSGDIRYKGRPERTKIKVSGSGDISQIQ